MYQLSQNEDKQEKLFAELKRALDEKNSRITPATLEQLPYLKACIKETLRMYPVVLGNGRSLQSDAVISGYNVPKGVSFLPRPRTHQTRIFTSTLWPFTDSCDLPALRAVEQGRVLPGAEQIHSREVAEERARVAERYPPLREPTVWVWTTNVHRQTLCRGRARNPPVEGNYNSSIISTITANNFLRSLSQIFRKYHVKYNYGAMSYRVSPTYIPDKPLKFQLTERDS